MISQYKLQQLQTLIMTGRADVFYSWPAWHEMRDEVLRFDCNECQVCKARGKYSKGIIVHHVKHLKDRPDLALSLYDGTERQLITLCRACHEEQHPERMRTNTHQIRPEVTQERWD